MTESDKELEQLALQARTCASLPFGVLVNDLAGKVIWCNQEFEVLTGYALGELQGRDILAVMSGNETDLAELIRIKESVSEMQDYAAELTLYSKDGRAQRLAVSGNLVADKAGVVIQENQIYRRLTVGRNAKLPAEVTSLLMSLSHEMSAPLNSVIGLTDVLDGNLSAKDQSENVALLRFLAMKVKAMLSGIPSMAENAKYISTGDNNVFNLDRLLSDTVGAIGLAADQNQTRVYLQTGLNVPSQVVGNDLHLFQILYNLLGNAVKFARRGEVWLKVTLVSQTKARVRLQFEVSDTGIGIPQQMLRKIFDPGVQASPAITSEFGGSGMGLAIVKQLLGRHGSEIRVISKPGGGARFMFSIAFGRANLQQVKRRSDKTTKLPLAT